MIYKESISLSSQKRFTRNIFNAWKFTRDKCTPGTCMHNFLDKNNKVIVCKVIKLVLQKCIREISRKRLIECRKQTWVIRRNVGSRSFLEGGFYDGKEKYCGVVGRLRTEYNKASNSTVKVIHRGMFTRIEIFPRCVSLS